LSAVAVASGPPAARSHRLAVWGLGLAATLALALAVAQLASYRFGLAPSALDSSTDAGIFGPLTTFVFAAAVAAAWALAALQPGIRTPALWCAALLTVVFALDAWSPPHAIALAAPFAAAALVLLWWLGSRDGSARMLLHAGCVVLAVSFAGHAIGAWIVTELGQAGNTWGYQAKVVIKHAGELAAWTLVATGLAALSRAPA
jgi:hypothetical protein